MLHVGLDLSRRKIDVCLLSAAGEIVEEFASSPDADGLLGLARRVGRHERPVRAVIESMTGARFVHDRLEALGWDVLIADAQKVKGLAPHAIPPTPSATSATSAASASSAAPESHRLTSPESSPRRFGTCSPTTRPLLPLREAPLFVWPPDGPFEIAPPEPASNDAWSSQRGGDREMSAAPDHQPARTLTDTRSHLTIPASFIESQLCAA
jgi:hypothetical protein